MDLTDFDALSFDCYGTLIDWEHGIAAALRPWATANGLTLTDEALLTAFSAHEADAEETHPTDLYPAILARSMSALGAQFGVPVTSAEAEAFGASVPAWPAFADSPDALARLARRFKLIILSNVDRTSFAGSNVRLGVTFTSIVTAQDVGSYKPSPRNFEALTAELDRLGIARERLLHVAQSLFHDHVPAKAAGLPTVWINRRHADPGWGATPEPSTPVTPDWTFPSLAAFVDAVDAAFDVASATRDVVLHGPRVKLRAATATDASALVAIWSEPEVSWWWRTAPSLGQLTRELHSHEDSAKFVIVVDGAVVGLVQYAEETDPDYRHASIDVFVSTRVQGRGLGTEAVTVLAEYLIDVLGHHRITIDPSAENAAAIRAYTKVGFRPVGVLRRYERGADGEWHDGLLMDLVADELVRFGSSPRPAESS